MKFRLPEDNNSGIGIDGQWFPAEFGCVDLPQVIVSDFMADIVAHGLTQEPVIAVATEKPVEAVSTPVDEDVAQDTKEDAPRRGRPRKE